MVDQRAARSLLLLSHVETQHIRAEGYATADSGTVDIQSDCPSLSLCLPVTAEPHNVCGHLRTIRGAGCVCACICVCLCVRTHVCVCVCGCVCMYVCVCTDTYI